MSQLHPWNDPKQRWEATVIGPEQKKCKHKWVEKGFWMVATWKDCHKCGAEAWPAPVTTRKRK